MVYPASSPWGPVKQSTKISSGFYKVSTETQGGVYLSPSKNKKIPEDFRTEDGWYEEELEAIIPILYFRKGDFDWVSILKKAEKNFPEFSKETNRLVYCTKNKDYRITEIQRGEKFYALWRFEKGSGWIPYVTGTTPREALGHFSTLLAFSLRNGFQAKEEDFFATVEFDKHLLPTL